MSRMDQREKKFYFFMELKKEKKNELIRMDVYIRKTNNALLKRNWNPTLPTQIDK